MSAPKKWYRSKTIQFNALIAALAAFESVTGIIEPFVGHSFYAALCIILPIGNAVLRVISSGEVTK